MSHTVTLQLDNLTMETKVVISQTLCCIDKLISENANNIDVLNFLQNQKNKINEQYELISKYKGIATGTSAFQARREIDKISKNVTNITSNKTIIDFVINQVEKEKEEILEIINDNGVIADEAIANLKEERIELSKSNILSEIEKIRNNNLSIEKEKKIKEKLYKFIDEQNFDNDDLQFELKKIINTKHGLQELNDCFAFISSKKNEELKIDELANGLFGDLQKNENFKLLEGTKKELDTDGILRKTYKLRNNRGNTMEIIIDGNLRIKYQLGNYVGHACEKTSEKIFNTIEKLGYGIVHKNISRNISNSKSLEMKKEFNF